MLSRRGSSRRSWRIWRTCPRAEAVSLCQYALRLAHQGRMHTSMRVACAAGTSAKACSIEMITSPVKCSCCSESLSKESPTYPKQADRGTSADESSEVNRRSVAHATGAPVLTVWKVWYPARKQLEDLERSHEEGLSLEAVLRIRRSQTTQGRC